MTRVRGGPDQVYPDEERAISKRQRHCAAVKAIGSKLLNGSARRSSLRHLIAPQPFEGFGISGESDSVLMPTACAQVGPKIAFGCSHEKAANVEHARPDQCPKNFRSDWAAGPEQDLQQRLCAS